MNCINVGHYPTGDIRTVEPLIEKHGYRSVRWMNWLQPYSYDGERLIEPRDDWQYRSGAWNSFQGVPLATIIDTANRLNVSSYINLPYKLSKAAMFDAVRILEKRHINRYYITVGCEAGWNSAGKYAAQYAHMQALGDGDDWQAAARGYASRLTDLAESPIVRGLIVAEMQNTDWQKAAYLLGETDANEFVRALAVAPYYGREHLNNHLDKDASGLFELCSNDLFGVVRDGIESHGDLAARHGLRMMAYEWSMHLIGGHPHIKKALPMIAELRPHFAAIWAANGGDEAYYYRLNHTKDDSQHWRLVTT